MRLSLYLKFLKESFTYTFEGKTRLVDLDLKVTVIIY